VALDSSLRGHEYEHIDGRKVIVINGSDCLDPELKRCFLLELNVLHSKKYRCKIFNKSLVFGYEYK